MEADFDLGEDGELVDAPGFRRGTYRPRGGRPPGYSPKKAAALANDIARNSATAAPPTPPADPDEDSNLAVSVRLNIAKARKEAALAGLNELQLKIKSGEYLPRDAYREATATLVAMLSQGLRSLPDLLERRCNLPPEALQMVEVAIDESLSHLAEQLALFTEVRR